MSPRKIALKPLPSYNNALLRFVNEYRRNNGKNKWTRVSVSYNTCAIDPFQNGKVSTRKYINEKYPMIDERLYSIPRLVADMNPVRGCQMVVLGTFELIAPFFNYNKKKHNTNGTEPFILLAAEHWTEELNQRYISCAFELLFTNKTCTYPICIILPKNLSLLKRNNGSPRVTLLELSIIVVESNKFTIHMIELGNEYEFTIYLLKPKEKQIVQ